MRIPESLRAQRCNLQVTPRACRLPLVFVFTACLCFPGDTVLAYEHRRDPQSFSRQYHERLVYYRSVYPDEIFGYCWQLYYKKIRKLKKCLDNQFDWRKKILAEARQQTGSNTLAQVIYDDCLAYYPSNGVGRIGACVDTRLILFERVGDIAVERSIYRKCESKWRHSGAPAIDVCCAHEGSYYQRHGELRD